MGKEKKNRILWAHVALLLLAALLLMVVCATSMQAIMAMPLPVSFQGEYSQDGGAWLPLEEGTELSALDGDLTLRGHFSVEISEGLPIHFYVDHIAYCISVNGEAVAWSSTWEWELTADMCAKDWAGFSSPGIGTEDLVEIQLHNPHRLGNTRAYSEFLDSIFLGSEAALQNTLGEQNRTFRTLGFAVMVLSLAVTGLAAAFVIMGIPAGAKLLTLGLASFFAGGYITLDTSDVSLWSSSNVFNTYALLLCIMLAAFELGMAAAMSLTTRAKKVARAAVYAEGAALAVVMVLCLTGRVILYDTLVFWVPAQVVLCIVLLLCCLYEWLGEKVRPGGSLAACMLLMAAALPDLVNVYFAWWANGAVIKVVFVLAFVVLLVRGVRTVPEYYRAAVQAEKLEGDLKNSRITLAMSQIRTHFIFNILNAISGMCKYDPEKADKTVVRFARYLRTNIDILQEDQPVTFHAALQHLEDYVALEQVRFGDKLRFTTDIAVEEFLIPPLVLQPIVENAIKHGLLPKPQGGTVTLRTWREADNVLIAIRDDGVGFDPNTLGGSRSVGLSNVRFRLRHMMHASLDIKSAPGQGTTVTISIPWEEANPCM